MYRIIISLSSNSYAKLNIDKAKRMLTYIFPDIRFSNSIISLSDNNENEFPYRNVLGVFYDEVPIKELVRKLKEIEYSVGRLPKDKETGKIIIDIDLLQYGDFFTREEDMEKQHIKELMTEIGKLE